MNETCFSVSILQLDPNKSIFECSFFTDDNLTLINVNAYAYNELSTVYLKKSGKIKDFYY